MSCQICAFFQFNSRLWKYCNENLAICYNVPSEYSLGRSPAYMPSSRNCIIKYILTVDVAVSIYSPYSGTCITGRDIKREYFIVLSIGSPNPPTSGGVGDIPGSWSKAISIPIDPSRDYSMKVRT